MSQIQTPAKETTKAAATRRVADPHRPVHSPAGPAATVGIFDESQRAPLAILGLLLVLLVAAYWDMFTLTKAAWEGDGLYSHGWIIPVIALGLLWLRWEPFGPVPMRERWIGLALLAFGLSMRLVAAKFIVLHFDRWSFIPSMLGLFTLVGGLNALRWSWPGLVFLFFMFPWPSKFEIAVLGTLQKWATASSTIVLQTLGVAAFRTGNLISIPGLGQPLNVAEACAGLRMATIFGALAVAMVFVIERPWWDKFVILLSAIPIALIVNIVRITVTALCYMVVGRESYAVQEICHHYAGLVIMMPLALALLWIELQVLERVTIPVDTVQLRPIGGVRGAAPMPTR